MHLLNAFLLGIVQGVAEFLPISSSGHLSIAQNLLNLGVEGTDDVFLTYCSTWELWWLCSPPTGRTSAT